jgi:hypothetical protein
MFESLANGLTATLNGLLTMILGIADLRVVLFVAVAASAVWLAACEIEELDRQGIKPDVVRH